MADINNSFYTQVIDEWSLSHNQLVSWKELVKQQTNGSFFLDYDWLNLWWYTFSQPDDALKLILIYNEEVLVAILPFYLKKGKILYFIGTGEDEKSEVCTEYLDIIIANEYKDILLNIISNLLLKEFKKTQQIMFVNVLHDSYAVQLIERIKKHYLVTKKSVGVRYIINLPSSYLSYEAMRSKSFISQANRKKRKFEKLGGKFIHANNLAGANAMFDQLTTLHNARWSSVGLNGAFQDERFLNFHRAFIKILFQNNQLSLTALTINNQVVGVIYNIIANETCYFYQIGIEIDDFQNLSLGTILHLSEIKGSISQGYKHYDFMKGEKIKSYKQNFTDTTYEMLNLHLYKKGIRAYLKNIMRQVIQKIKDITKWKINY